MRPVKFNIHVRLLIFTVLSSGLIACGGGSDETAANTAPVAADAGVSLLPGGTVNGTLSVNDVDGDNLAISIVTDASNGTLVLDNTSTGAYTYSHDGNVNGDRFTFWANDGLLDSNIATVTVTTVVPDTPVSGLLATPGDQRVILNWDAVTGADSYNVYWTDTPGSGAGGTKITGVTSPYYHDGLTNGLNYYYVVTAVNVVGESATSSEVNATPVDISVASLTIVNVNLNACIQTAGATYVHELTSLDCGLNGIVQLTGIEALSSLTSLSLYSNNIVDVSPLAGLTNLTNLVLGANSIRDLSPLAGLTSLADLDLGLNSIRDVSPLAGLSSLTGLNLSDNSIIDVSPLAGLSSLTTLDLSSNNITDVTHISGLISLTSLGLYDNNITDVSPLGSLTSLAFLGLNSNSIIDVSPLADLTSLTDLFLNTNSIIDVSPLADLTSLTTLDLSTNSIIDVSSLSGLSSLASLGLFNNTVMSCSSLDGLIVSLGSPPVDTDNNLGNTDTAIDGTNCTNP